MGASGKVDGYPHIGEYLENAYPIYHDLGMSYDDFWHGRLDLIHIYNKVQIYQVDKKPTEIELTAWVNGYYTYYAVGKAQNGEAPISSMLHIIAPEDPSIVAERERKALERSEQAIHAMFAQYKNSNFKKK